MKAALRASDGSQLIFSLTSRGADYFEFVVGVENSWLTAAAPAATYANGSPAALFREMAAYRKGWEDVKGWEDLEGRVRLSAMTDSAGRVRLEVVLAAARLTDQVQVTLIYDTDRLEEMSRQVAAVFEANDP
jgi:hypothetical protein